MIKFIKSTLITLIILGGVGYGIYYFGSNLIADQVMDSVFVELEDSGQLDEIREIVGNDPEIQQFIQEGAMLMKVNFLLKQRRKQQGSSFRRLASMNCRIFRLVIKMACQKVN